MFGQLKPGDKIVTTGGIYGTVLGVQQDRIELKIASTVKIDITRNAVAAFLSEKKEEKVKIQEAQIPHGKKITNMKN